MRYSFKDEPLQTYLPEFSRCRLNFKSTENFPVKILEKVIISPIESIELLDFSFLFRYEVFPKEILSFYGAWQSKNRPLEVGDIVVQAAHIPPKKHHIDLIFASQILISSLEKDSALISYGTLEGHPESGINTFSFFIRDKTLYAQVKTEAALIDPTVQFFGRFAQKYIDSCNAEALENLSRNFHRYN